MNKTIKTTASAVTCAALAAFALSACSARPVSPDGALSATDAYGMGAVSAVKLLGSAVPSQAFGKLAAIRDLNAPTDAAPDEKPPEEEVDKFHEYFTALDCFLTDDIVTTAVQENTDANYAFATKMTIKGVDMDGKTVEYVMHYTETLEKSKDSDEIEREYTLIGTMTLDGKDYALNGERSFEQDDKETENELKIRAYADPADKTSYIEMKQETSVEQGENETEYVYSVVTDGKTIEKTSVKFETETENGKTEDELKLKFEQGDAKGSYKLSRETKNGKTQIKVKYDANGKFGEFRITQKTNENGETIYEYEFADKSTKKYKKH